MHLTTSEYSRKTQTGHTHTCIHTCMPFNQAGLEDGVLNPILCVYKMSVYDIIFNHENTLGGCQLVKGSGVIMWSYN